MGNSYNQEPNNQQNPQAAAADKNRPLASPTERNPSRATIGNSAQITRQTAKPAANDKRSQNAGQNQRQAPAAQRSEQKPAQRTNQPNQWPNQGASQRTNQGRPNTPAGKQNRDKK